MKSIIPLSTVLLALFAIWYVAAALMNAPLQRDLFANAGRADYSTSDLAIASLNMERPKLPAPHQIAAELYKLTIDTAPTSKRSLVYHAAITLEETLIGFLFGAALGVGLAGMALILVPGLTGEGVKLTASGLLFALVAGLMYTVYLIGGKQLRRRDVHATTIVFAMSVLAAVILLPIGLAQASASQFTARNFAIAAFLGVVCTALTFSLVMDGMHYIKVQHAAIMGYIEPVSAPLYALVILSQVPSWWTIAGGALIIGAGVIVVRYGAAEAEAELPGFALTGPGAEAPRASLGAPRRGVD